jgi:cytochrome P450
VTATTAGHPPVLRFDSQPDGGPPPILRANATPRYALRPAGGPPMLVLRRRLDVVRVLSDTGNFRMAAVTESGDLLRCPLTGAEMQSPDGGLLNMNPPHLRSYRRRIAGLFSRRAAEATRPLMQALARSLADTLHGRPTVDAITAFAEPFTATAVSAAMGTPLKDWARILEASRIAFAVVAGPDAVDDVAAAWDDLYSYYTHAAARYSGGLTTRIAGALEGSTPAQIAHVTGTVSNGFGAFLPVLAVAIAELVQRPHVIASCARGERTWASVAAELLSTRTVFSVALPRVALADTWLGGRRISKGATLLPSLIAAAHDGPPSASIPFGAGPHYCPGAALSRVWLSVTLEAFFETFPRARLTGELDWQAGTLPAPREIPLALR